MPTAAYTAQLEQFSKTPTLLVKLTVKGDLGTTQLFRFSPKEGKPLTLQLSEDVRPYLLGDIRGRATRIRPDQSITERYSVTLKFVDDPNPPDFDPTVFSINTGSSFFKRLDAVAVSITGSEIEVLRGFVASGFLESDFETIFQGRVDDINFGSDNSVSIVAKDNLALIDKQVPLQISDGNVLEGAITATASTFTVSNGDEITDPASLDSFDFVPIVERLSPGIAAEEDVIINSRSGNVITVQQNLIPSSEDFGSVNWGQTPAAGVTVTSNTAINPFGGGATADNLEFLAVGNFIFRAQSFIPPQSNTFTFSVWAKVDSGTTGSVTLEIIDSGSVESGKASISLTDKFQRIAFTFTFTAGAAGAGSDVRIKQEAGDSTNVIVWGAQYEQGSSRGPYASTTFSDQGLDAGRGSYGTTASAHLDQAEFREVQPYRGQLSESGCHPVFICRDLINRGQLKVADINQDAFDIEQEFSEQTAFFRGRTVSSPNDTTIDKPVNLLRLLKEVKEQSLLDIFVDDDGKISVRFSFRGNSIDEPVATVTDETNIIEKSLKIKGNAPSRFTRVYVYFGLKFDSSNEAKAGDRADDFEFANGSVNFEEEDVPGQRVKKIFSKWIIKPVDATALAGRTLSRFKRPARIVEFLVDVKDDEDIILSRVLNINSIDLPIVGSLAVERGDVSFQVTQKVDKRNEGRVAIECTEFRGLRFGIIAPAGFPDYDAATGTSHLGHDDRLHGFVGRASDNKVGTALDEGYVVS